MKWYLEKLGPEGPTERFPLDEDQPTQVGRGRNCTIRLKDAQMSRLHCLLCFRKGRWEVSDLGSRNGTHCNGRSIKKRQLSPGDVIGLGETRLRLCLESLGPAEAPATEAWKPQSNIAQPASPLAAPTSSAGSTRPGANARGLLGRRYELGRHIHVGSTGAFHEAVDVESGQTVCVKLLAKKLTADETELRRFVRGVRTAAKLGHPNIVQLYRAGHSGPQWWLAMEYVDGPSLQQLIAQFGVGSMLSPGRVLSIAREIAAALEVAYEHQVLHRNIRPDNILLTRGGIAKLSDFTLTRGVVLTTLQHITASSEVIGDLTYMAPERTDPGGSVDCRSDLYSLGACLYTLLAGRPPFTGRGTVDLIDKIRHEPTTPPSRFNLAVPGPLEGVVLRLLAKSPSDRFASPMDLRKELVRVSRLQGMGS